MHTCRSLLIPPCLFLLLAACQGPQPAQAPSHPTLSLTEDASRAILAGDREDTRVALARLLQGQERAEVYLWWGRTLLGREGEAEQAFRWAHRLAAGDAGVEAEALTGLADALLLQGRYREAYEGYQAARRLGASDRPDYVLYRAGEAAMRVGDWSVGRKLLAELVRTHPLSPVRGQAARKLSHPEDRYANQAGAFGTPAPASQLRRRLAAQGFPDARVVRLNGKAGTLYVVWVGHYLSWDLAHTRLAELARVGVHEAHVVP